MHSMNSTTSNHFTIGRLAAQADVGVDTIRFYERRGLLPKPERTASGYRIYKEETINRIRFVRRAKRLGFTLDEIELLLKLQDEGGEKSTVKDITTHKLAEIDAKISDLNRMRKVLTKLASECSGKGSISTCPIIDAISDNDLDNP
jgi:Hg(II)-responsive transcriptional regulator